MEKAGNVLNHLLFNLLQKEQNKNGTVYYQFFNKWEIIVGKRLYGHTKIIDVKNGTLIVAVDHPGWLQIVRMKDKIIIKTIQKTFPQLHVKSMKISVQEEFFQVKEEKKDDEKPNQEEKREEIENFDEQITYIDTIKDKQLRNVLKRLYMSIAKKEEES